MLVGERGGELGQWAGHQCQWWMVNVLRPAREVAVVVTSRLTLSEGEVPVDHTASRMQPIDRPTCLGRPADHHETWLRIG